jgi:predicted ribosome-associated RNA-binding protein Tma20
MQVAFLNEVPLVYSDRDKQHDWPLCFLSPCRSSYMQVAFLNEVPLFYSDRDNHWFPTLRILHQYPDMMPKLRCDKGAIKFVLSGANIMCPGLTSPGATIHDEVISVTYVTLLDYNSY